jgi:hypothetical protein
MRSKPRKRTLLRREVIRVGQRPLTEVPCMDGWPAKVPHRAPQKTPGQNPATRRPYQGVCPGLVNPYTPVGR